MSLPPIVDSHLRLGAPPAEVARLLDGAGVERAIVVQPEPSMDETRAALALAADAPFAAGAVVWVDIESPSLSAVLDEVASSPKARGICLAVDNRDSNHWLMGEAVLRGLREVAARGLSLDVIASPAQIPSVQALAAALPELRIALAHLGSPPIARSEREPWGVYMLNLAPCRNVSLKMSGLLTLDTQPNWSVAHLRLFVEPAARLFGYSRLLFGSDWPGPASVAGYRDALDAVVEAVAPTTDAQLARVLGGSAAEFYRLA